MKILIIYYSLDGHTRFVAEKISSISGGDLLELRTVKQLPSTNLIRHFWGGKQVITGERPELLPFFQNPADYDLIFIGTPVWAFSYAPAFKTFFHQIKISGKKIALFCTNGGAPGATFKNLKKELSDNQIIGEQDFKNPFADRKRSVAAVEKWAREII